MVSLSREKCIIVIFSNDLAFTYCNPEVDILRDIKASYDPLTSCVTGVVDSLEQDVLMPLEVDISEVTLKNHGLTNSWLTESVLERHDNVKELSAIRRLLEIHNLAFATV